MSIELAKYMAQKWMEDELELMGYVMHLSCSDAKEFTEWFKEESPKYRKLSNELKKEAMKRVKRFYQP